MTRGNRFVAAWVGFTAALSAAVLTVGCTEQPQTKDAVNPEVQPLRLVVVTPHNQRIRNRFSHAFSDWHLGEFGTPVNIQWIKRGTPRCLTYIEEAATSNELVLRHMVPDVMLGGGISDHQYLADAGLAAKTTAPLPNEQTIPTTLLGVPLRDQQGYWHTTALTAFGIFCHQQGLAERDIPTPQNWKDLAEPAYYGWLAIADPTRSGSNRFCMNLILQRYGWEQGWGLLMRIMANSRALLASSDDAIMNVSSGMCLAGLSVNFNALHEAATHGEDKLAFIDPDDATAITPDLVSILSYASSPRMAERFVRFCLSEPGQALWSLKAKQEPGSNAAGVDSGAFGSPLYRFPVVPAIYEKYGDQLSVKGNPYERKSDFVVDMELEQRQATVVPAMLLAACGPNHILLQKAWKSVIDAGMPADALSELTKPIIDEQTAYQLGKEYQKGGDTAYHLAADWTAQFRAKYEKVLAMTKS